MTSKIITLSECRKGLLLAEDAINNQGVVLVTRETTLNDYIINKLSKNGINKLAVYNTSAYDNSDAFSVMFHRDYSRSIIKTKALFQRLLSGEALNNNHVQHITSIIKGYLSSGDDIIKCLDRVQQIDDYTYYHSVNVALYSMLIARALNMSDVDIERAVQSGLLHDLGKVKIPDIILNKKGRLTDEEFEIIKYHPIFGYELIDSIEGVDQEVKMAVLMHHERLDGSGYPYHCKPEDKKVNIFSRIVALADVFDAMTSDRIYKNKTTPFEVFKMFQSDGNAMFDIKLMKSFIDRLAVYLVDSKVLLSNGESGTIVYVPLHNVISPVIQVKSQYIDLSQNKELKIVSMM